MDMKKIRVMDWLVHGGHQYEFFKVGCDFFCTLLSGYSPVVKSFNRPPNGHVQFISERKARMYDFNVIMIRAGLNPKRYDYFRRRRGPKPVGIAVMQTTEPFEVPKWTKCIVWNSEAVMKKYIKDFSSYRNFYIPHGFSPYEFSKNTHSVGKNGRVLNVSNLFKDRGVELGYSNWKYVSDSTGICDVVGRGNEDVAESIGHMSFKELIHAYKTYSVYLNTTEKSAMPRSRGEAMMCGMPIVTTNNFGIEKYLLNNKNCIFADTKGDMVFAVDKILKSKDLSDDLGGAARETAIKYFNISDYIERWKYVFEKAIV